MNSLRVGVVLALLIQPAAGHDFWMNVEKYKNPKTGIPCCGTGDCGILSEGSIRPLPGYYHIKGTWTKGASITGNPVDGPTVIEDIDEMVPFSEALPSPDGTPWRCENNIQKTRCLFVPSEARNYEHQTIQDTAAVIRPEGRAAVPLRPPYDASGAEKALAAEAS